jgi:hypothetical protein
MTQRDIERPEPNSVPGGLDSERDLIANADDSPDILQGGSDGEADLDSVTLADSVPFRRPVAGSRLSEEQLERDVE